MTTGKTIAYSILALAVGWTIASHAGGQKQTEVSSSLKVPETYVLAHLAKTYEPVTFSHRMHCLVAEDCAVCHHHSQAGQTPSCTQCHGVSAASKKAGIPGLKEAYHGQCMGCHREMEMGPTGCTECHARKTTEAAPSEKLFEVTAEQGPESLTLNRLENRYGGVKFSHGTHTEMTEGCATCHHHSPAGQIVSCGECHHEPFDPDNLNMPGLKGAYHLQCMGCHEEMDSGPLGCSECHAKKVAQTTGAGKK
jgi:hypothetical protein